MTSEGQRPPWPSDARVQEDLQEHPHLFLRLAENALTVAESVRDNYFHNTARFVGDLRRATQRPHPPVAIHRVPDADWSALQGEVVTFIDGGVGQVRISSQAPILLRVGSYAVRTGERRLAEREQFGYYPIILGDLEGGSKDRNDFVDVVRITAELLGGLSALTRTPDLRVLMFHGPLVTLVGTFAGHTPFTEGDIDLFLRQYALDPALARRLKEEFLQQARLDIYPKLAPERSDLWADRRLFEPLSWMAYLLRRLIEEARARTPTAVIAGVVERGALRAFLQDVLLERVFRGLRTKGNPDYFNDLYGRQGLTSPENVLDRLGYTDALLLGMLMEPGQFSEPWEIKHHAGLGAGRLALPEEAFRGSADWAALAPPSPFGFPRVHGSYLHVSPATEPLRVEVFAALGPDQLVEAVRRAYLYAKLLPGYGFPVGLDVVDKYARVPTWLTTAYDKMIRHHLSVGLQRGEISDAETRRLLVQAIYMTNRDWLFRPSV